MAWDEKDLAGQVVAGEPPTTGATVTVRRMSDHVEVVAVFGPHTTLVALTLGETDELIRVLEHARRATP
ncbi:MAG TPA: hypothetical protein VFE26_10870 [Trebonia sp.]|jgi:hypothetical protein|nr:hypothetical protein [Trebonia sp.]